MDGVRLRMALCAALVLSSLATSALARSPSPSGGGAPGDAARSVNAFALRAAAQLGASSDADFFLSPWSVVTALGMTYAGARGETASEMEEALLFSPEIHASAGALSEELMRELDGRDGRPALTSANRVWVREGLGLLPAFTEILGRDYASEVAQVDFAGDPGGAREAINGWVEDHTNGRIRDLLRDVRPDTRMILTNAVWYKGRWRYPFSARRTAPEPFHVTEAETKDVPMMRQFHELSYGELGGVELLRLPYAGRLSMFLALPGQGAMEGTLAALAEDPALFDRWRGALRPHRVDVRLPKFKSERRYEMAELLGALGVRLAFGDGADFSGMTTDEPLKIDSVIHQTFIDVDEEETEAAAATAITMVRATAAPQREELPWAEFHADRPFLHFIVDEPTGTILFMGRQGFR